MPELDPETEALILAWSQGTREDRERITDEAIGRLTPREQGLVREAAVMAYVLGRMSGLRDDDPHPRDTAVYRETVCECAKAGPGRYPFIGGIA